MLKRDVWVFFGSLCFDPVFFLPMDNASSSFIILSFTKKKLKIFNFCILQFRWYIESVISIEMDIKIYSIIPENAKYWYLPKYVEAFPMHLFILWLCVGKCKDWKTVPYIQGFLIILFVLFLLISNTLYWGALQYAVLTVKRMSTFSYLCFYKSDEYITNIS